MQIKGNLANLHLNEGENLMTWEITFHSVGTTDCWDSWAVYANMTLETVVGCWLTKEAFIVTYPQAWFSSFKQSFFYNLLRELYVDVFSCIKKNVGYILLTPNVLTEELLIYLSFTLIRNLQFYTTWGCLTTIVSESLRMYSMCSKIQYAKAVGILSSVVILDDL